MTKKARAYESYDGFLRESIRTYWESKRGKRINFLALLFACKEAWGAAWDEVKDPGMAKKVLTGAAGAAAVAVVLRLVLGGPIGLLLTGASIASLVALYIRNHKKIMARTGHYRGIIEDYRPKYEKLTAETGDLDDDARELMIDGLMSRFLDELDAYQPEEEEEGEYEDDEDDGDEDDDEDAPSEFARHVESKRDEDKDKS